MCIFNPSGRFDQPVIGLNTERAAAPKQWREEGHRSTRLGCRWVQFLLLGAREKARNERLTKDRRLPLRSGMRQHAPRLLSHCDDGHRRHARHASRPALGKRTVVLFGPTSAAEIELYGLGEKVVPKMECLSCYKTSCDFVPNCMDLISTEMVENAVSRQLAAARDLVHCS